jgi:hypothetical protein
MLRCDRFISFRVACSRLVAGTFVVCGRRMRQAVSYGFASAISLDKIISGTCCVARPAVQPSHEFQHCWQQFCHNRCRMSAVPLCSCHFCPAVGPLECWCLSCYRRCTGGPCFRLSDYCFCRQASFFMSLFFSYRQLPFALMFAEAKSQRISANG